MFPKIYSKSKICRICSGKCENALNIYCKIHIHDKILKDCIEEMCDISVSSEDGLPESICPTCIEQLEQSYSFRVLARQNDAYLHKMLDSKNKKFQKECNDSTTADSIPENVKCENTTNNVVHIIDLEEEMDQSQEIDKSKENIKPKELLINEDGNEYNDDDYDYSDDHQMKKLLAHTPEVKLDETTGEPEKKKRKYNCNYCNQTFVYLKSKHKHEKRHVKTDSKGSSIKCSVCKIYFHSTRRLNEHLYTHLTNNVLKPLYKCDKCENEYQSQSELQQHLTRHDQFKCLQCGKECYEINTLKYHVEFFHIKEKNYHCFCGKSFVTQSRLEQHQKSKKCKKTPHDDEDEVILIPDDS